jgi:hypothetical protein
MPKLYQGENGLFYTKKWFPNTNVITQHITDEGVDYLFEEGYGVGDELGSAYWDLYNQDWLYTLGTGVGGGHLEPDEHYIPNDALTPFGIQSQVDTSEPITLTTDGTYPNAPVFMQSPSTGIYYTILCVENSSDYYLQVPLLIKRHGAMELLQLGAELGDEFTESGLRLIFERRWGYFDEERSPY